MSTPWKRAGRPGRFFSGPAAKGAAGDMFRGGLQVRITRYTSVTLRHPTAPIPYHPPTYPTPAPYPAPAPQPEGKWMSTPSRSSEGPAPVVAELDGKRVHIGGYIVPLDFDATRVKEFLLVPFVGACIHVPPPPANQIVYVKTEQGFDVQGTFDPVWVTGTLKVTPAFTGLAEAGYSLEAEKVEARPRG